MSGEVHFDINKVKHYANKKLDKKVSIVGNLKFLLTTNFDILAILSLFDKNCDGKITKKELRSVKKEDYEKYMSEVKQYNTNPTKRVSYSYDELYDFAYDSYITLKELLRGNNTPRDINIPEVKTFKGIDQMSSDEINKELEQLKTQIGMIEIFEKNTANHKKYLQDLREKRIVYDKGSNDIDGHIGTYLQGENMMCTLLAYLDTLTDEEIQGMYEEKTDENGNKYYEVTFPSETSPVIVTQQELDDGEITVVEKGKKINLSDFSVGDRDVRMFEMAYVKQFGTKTYKKGAIPYETQNKFIQKNKMKCTWNKNLEKTTDYSTIPQNATIGVLYDYLIRKKKLPKTCELPNGQTLSVYDKSVLCFYNNGQLLYSIPKNHAMSFRKYDAETNEIVISGSKEENLSEIRIPAIPEVMAYFDITY